MIWPVNLGAGINFINSDTVSITLFLLIVIPNFIFFTLIRFIYFISSSFIFLSPYPLY